MRNLIATAVLATVLLGFATPAAIPEGPISFIKVDELKTLLGQGRRVDVIDVRHWESYAEMHIKGARSMPLRVIEARAPKEISKTGLVVFY
jgi:rhodanese-related sulfurtransferase